MAAVWAVLIVWTVAVWVGVVCFVGALMSGVAAWYFRRAAQVLEQNSRV